jgi:hypothetical protein
MRGRKEERKQNKTHFEKNALWMESLCGVMHCSMGTGRSGGGRE